MILLIAAKTRLQYNVAVGSVSPPVAGMHEGQATIPVAGDGRDAIVVTLLRCDAAFEIEEKKP